MRRGRPTTPELLVPLAGGRGHLTVACCKGSAWASRSPLSPQRALSRGREMRIPSGGASQIPTKSPSKPKNPGRSSPMHGEQGPLYLRGPAARPEVRPLQTS